MNDRARHGNDHVSDHVSDRDENDHGPYLCIHILDNWLDRPSELCWDRCS